VIAHDVDRPFKRTNGSIRIRFESLKHFVARLGDAA